MADLGNFWNHVRASRQELREKFGIKCPKCIKLQPKRNPTILLPQQRCKVDGYRDPRPRINQEEL